MSVDDTTLRLARKLRVKVGAEVDGTVRQIVQAWARAWDEIHGVWADALMDLAKASTDGQWPAPWEVARAERAQAALLAATDQIVELANFVGVTVTDATGRVVTATAPLEAEIIAAQMPSLAGKRVDLAAQFNRLDDLALARIVERTAQQVTSATWALSISATDAMKRALVRGIAVGDHPERVARDMLERARGEFNGGLARALTIARTEMLDAHREAARGQHIANADVLAGWQWLAQLDKRTCPSCWAKHGSMHDLTEQGPNDHQNGRCARLPVLKSWRALGFDIDEPPSVVPDAQAVFGDLSRADQLAIMGPGRLAALDAGAPWAEMSQRRVTTGWRASYGPTPVQDLLARVPAKV